MALVPSQVGFNLIYTWEGFRTNAYQDGGGVWTIGYGTIRYPDGTAVKKGDVCTKEQAQGYAADFITKEMHELSKVVIVNLNQNQIDAITCFTYNVGVTVFENSTMLTQINQQNWVAAANQFCWQDSAGNWHGWVHVNGHIDQGLVNRRKAEKALFSTPVAAPDFSNVVSGSSTTSADGN